MAEQIGYLVGRTYGRVFYYICTVYVRYKWGLLDDSCLFGETVGCSGLGGGVEADKKHCLGSMDACLPNHHSTDICVYLGIIPNSCGLWAARKDSFGGTLLWKRRRGHELAWGLGRGGITIGDHSPRRII